MIVVLLIREERERRRRRRRREPGRVGASTRLAGLNSKTRKVEHKRVIDQSILVLTKFLIYATNVLHSTHSFFLNLHITRP